MKKLLYTLLAVSIIFSACKKEEDKAVTPTIISGCTDADATNYNASATQDDSSCMYNISGVWETTTALFNGINELAGLQLTYIWDAGAINRRTYDADTIMTSYLEIAGPGILTDGDPSVVEWTEKDGVSLTWYIDKMSNDSNMTWKYTTEDGATVVETLVKSTTYTLSDWK